MFTNVKYEENEDDKTIFEYSVCSDKFVCMHGENKELCRASIQN